MFFARINRKQFNIGIIVFFVLALFFYQYFNLSNVLTYSSNNELVLRLGDLLTTFRSIIIQAFPFVMLGTAISAIVGSDIISSLKIGRVGKYIPIFVTKILQIEFIKRIYITFLGFLIPVCECGNVPVARRLMLKGFTPATTITFLLAAPIINPITLWSTSEAFGDSVIVISRIVGAIFIANLVGFVFSQKKDQNDLLTKQFYKEICEHKAEENHNKLKHIVEIFKDEFMHLFPMLCIGAFIAAVSQTIIPRDIIFTIGQSPILSIVAMLFLAFIISICSSTDAFIALAYAGTFTTGSIAAFLIFGPMIDIKILTLLKSSFKTSTLVIMTGLVLLFSFLIGLGINYFL